VLGVALLQFGCDPGSPAPETVVDEAAVASDAAGPGSADAGERRAAPGFALASLDGDLVRSDELAGKTLVLDFWATWCPPCEFQVPELNRFWEAHQADGDVLVFGISVDTEGPEVVREWVTQKGVAYPILVGGEELARRFGALGFPTLYVVAPDGTIELSHVGLIELADLEGALEGAHGRPEPEG
jgi:thiol-disulfide isomerase/thioredoxin